MRASRGGSKGEPWIRRAFETTSGGYRGSMAEFFQNGRFHPVRICDFVVNAVRRRLSVAPTAILVCFATFGTAGCGPGETEQVQRASKELAASLASDVSSGERRSVPARDSLPSCRIDSSDVRLEGGLRLYLDATQSMAGFTGGAATATRFDNVLDRISGLTGLSRLTLFGRQSETGGEILTEARFGPDLHRKGTFVRTYNPDYCLFRAFTAAGGEGVHLYVSDGVQSAVSFGVPSPTAVALRQWLSDGRSLAILAFRSEFSGRAWSEQLRNWVGTAEVDRRPFYLFVLAPDDAALDAVLEDRVGPDDFDGDVELFRFSPDPVRCRVEASGQYQNRASEPAWSFLTAAQQERLEEAEDEVATVSCERTPNYPLGEVLARVDTEYRPWRTEQGTFAEPENPPPMAAYSAQPVSNGSSGGLPDLKVRGRAPDDTDTRFGLYHLQLEIHPGDLVATAEEITTDSDADPESFDRTYRFDWLLEHLVRWQMARTAPRESFFLTLTYR